MIQSLERMKHIDHALVAKGHPPMYVMHKYWARKPHNVVNEYIKHYSEEGDVVLDPFCGSGVTAIEALKLNRKAIAVDLNPIATFITKITADSVDINEIEKNFKRIKEKCETLITELYKTKCKKCNKTSIIITSVWDREKNVLDEIRYYCNNCKKKQSKKPDKKDLNLIKKIRKNGNPYWYPKEEFPKGITFDQGRREAGPHFYDLFTDRNLYCVSLLWHEIKKIKDSKVREMMSFAFTSMLHLASKMTPDRPSRPYSSFWALNSYWVPPKFMESNVWALFENAVIGRQGIVKGKLNSNSQIKEYEEASSFKDLDNKNILIEAGY